MPHHIEKKILWKDRRCVGYMMIIANHEMCGVYWSASTKMIPPFTSISELRDLWTNTLDKRLPQFDGITNL